MERYGQLHVNIYKAGQYGHASALIHAAGIFHDQGYDSKLS